MINTLETYRASGAKAGKARNQHDESRAVFEHNWFNRARRLESGQDRVEADKAFRAGYADERAFK